MKRNMDVIREILLKVEADGNAFGVESLQVDGRDEDEVNYHVGLLVEAGLLSGIDATSRDSSSPDYISLSLTWQGYDFLDAARPKGRWDEAKRVIGEKAGTVSFAVLTQLLTAMATKALGL